MKPEVWGPSTWTFLHSVTLGYPVEPTMEDKIRFKQFFLNLQYVLPCEKCRVNFITHIEKFPLNDKALESKTSLFKWLVDVHNSVNQMNGKPIMNYDTVANFYVKMYDDTSYTYCFKIILLFIVTIMIATIVIVFKKYFVNL